VGVVSFKMTFYLTSLAVSSFCRPPFSQ